jgi:hypothetical protein
MKVDSKGKENDMNGRTLAEIGTNVSCNSGDFNRDH